MARMNEDTVLSLKFLLNDGTLIQAWIDTGETEYQVDSDAITVHGPTGTTLAQSITGGVAINNPNSKGIITYTANLASAHYSVAVQLEEDKANVATMIAYVPGLNAVTATATPALDTSDPEARDTVTLTAALS